MNLRIKIYSPTFMKAARLAADMNLHITQWVHAGAAQNVPSMTYADVEPLFQRIAELEAKEANNAKGLESPVPDHPAQ